MGRWLDAMKKDKMYLSIVLALSCSLFISGYQYIRRINRMEPEPLPVAERPKIQADAAAYSPGDRLLEVKLGRDRERSRELERMEALMAQSGLSDQVRREAEREYWRLTQAISKEKELENILKANGFDHCMVTVGSKHVTVVVGEKLTPERARSFGEYTAEVTGFGLEQVRIVEQP